MKPKKGAKLAPKADPDAVLYQGLQYSNLPARLGDLCAVPSGGVNGALWLQFRDTATLDDMLDMEEIDTVSRSWRAAAEANHAAKNEKR